MSSVRGLVAWGGTGAVPPSPLPGGTRVPHPVVWQIATPPVKSHSYVYGHSPICHRIVVPIPGTTNDKPIITHTWYLRGGDWRGAAESRTGGTGGELASPPPTIPSTDVPKSVTLLFAALHHGMSVLLSHASLVTMSAVRWVPLRSKARSRQARSVPCDHTAHCSIREMRSAMS